jgi:energy-coupling factor transport system permease protein
METRGYDPYEKRTKYREYPIKWTDIVVFLIVITIGVLVILNKVDVLPIPKLL